nr:IPT/TIG domain-containing protein [Streptomyces sp. NBC_00691]
MGDEEQGPGPNPSNTALLSTVAAVLPSAPAHAAGPGQLIYVANQNGNSVTALDSASGATTATITVGTAPIGLALTPDGSQAWVTNNGSNTVSVIDTGANAVAATVPVGASPRMLTISPDGRWVYVAHTGSPAGIEVIDTLALVVAGTIPTGTYPSALALSPDGGRLYVGDFNSNSVAVVDTASNTVTATIPTSDPVGIAVTPDGAHVYVGNRLGNSVSVLDTATNTVTATIGVGAGTNAVLADPDGTRVYASNSFSDNMSVIDTATRTVVSTVATGSRPYGMAIGKAALPTVTALTPDHGPTTGATTLTLTGSNLTGTTTVDFGGRPASRVLVVDDTTVTAVAPPRAAGSVDVTLTAKGRTTPAGTYTYDTPAPGITGIDPATGPAAGGTTVTLTGAHLTGATAVSFGTVAATSFNVVNNTTITATAPAATAAGPVDITVATPGGTSTTTAADRYTYAKGTTQLTASPVLLSIAPGQLIVNLALSATLTDTTTGKPVPGTTIKFTVGTTTVCTAVTNAVGTATCTGPCPVISVLLGLGYTATYTGSAVLEPATATASLIRIG